VTIVGTLLLALAGAYLLRALTEAGALSPTAGVSLGLLYALGSIPWAARSARAGRQLTACSLGATTALVAYPLLWEAARRFTLLPTAWALGLATATLAAALTLAARGDLTPVAWLHTGSALAFSSGLLLSTRHLAAATAALLAQAALVEWFARRPSWSMLRWAAAAVLDLSVLATVAVVGRAGGPPDGYPPLSSGVALAVALALPALYLVRSRPARCARADP
jgi:hypothetical protein